MMCGLIASRHREARLNNGLFSGFFQWYLCNRKNALNFPFWKTFCFSWRKKFSKTFNFPYFFPAAIRAVRSDKFSFQSHTF